MFMGDQNWQRGPILNAKIDPAEPILAAKGDPGTKVATFLPKLFGWIDFSVTARVSVQLMLNCI